MKTGLGNTVVSIFLPRDALFGTSPSSLRGVINPRQFLRLVSLGCPRTMWCSWLKTTPFSYMNSRSYVVTKKLPLSCDVFVAQICLYSMDIDSRYVSIIIGDIVPQSAYVRTKPPFWGLLYTCFGCETMTEGVRILQLFFNIGLCSATSIESYRRDLLNDMPEHNQSWKKKNTYHPVLVSHSKQV